MNKENLHSRIVKLRLTSMPYLDFEILENPFLNPYEVRKNALIQRLRGKPEMARKIDGINEWFKTANVKVSKIEYNTVNDPIVDLMHIDVVFYFSTDNDALLFKLKWL